MPPFRDTSVGVRPVWTFMARARGGGVAEGEGHVLDAAVVVPEAGARQEEAAPEEDAGRSGEADAL